MYVYNKAKYLDINICKNEWQDRDNVSGDPTAISRMHLANTAHTQLSAQK